jgi:lipid A ethanolaminephosphotransferase
VAEGFIKNHPPSTGRWMQMMHWRVALSPSVFILIASFFNAIVFHGPLYRFANENAGDTLLGNALNLGTIFVIVFAITAVASLIFYIVARWSLKPWWVLVFLCNALALYFINTYQVTLDKTMMGNVFGTDPGEAMDLFHPKLLAYIVLLGLLPSLLVLKIQLSAERKRKTFAVLCAVGMLALAWLYFASQSWLWVDKHAKKIGGMILPWSYVVNTSRYEWAKFMDHRDQILLPAATSTSHKKTLVVLVIGESARAKNFSLYGYSRPTNPELEALNIIALKGAKSCATYTTASVNCILSHNDEGATLLKNEEPLPNYLQRNGVDVYWRSNNSGEAPLKVHDYKNAGDLKPTCQSQGQNQGCDYDEVLLTDFKKIMASTTSDKVLIVLHPTGSHGPSYYKKYPPQFEKFKPTCQTVDLNTCSSEQLLNAYDNTIAYADHFLAEVVRSMQGVPDYASTMLYVSDHGESLGEYGLYLHGTPYSMAPDVQKDIPFLVWMSQRFIQDKSIAVDRLRARQSFSHRHIFHSVMGAFDMTSPVYEAAFNIFNPAEPGSQANKNEK